MRWDPGRGRNGSGGRSRTGLAVRCTVGPGRAPLHGLRRSLPAVTGRAISGRTRHVGWQRPWAYAFVGRLPMVYGSAHLRPATHAGCQPYWGIHGIGGAGACPCNPVQPAAGSGPWSRTTMAGVMSPGWDRPCPHHCHQTDPARDRPGVGSCPAGGGGWARRDGLLLGLFGLGHLPAFRRASGPVTLLPRSTITPALGALSTCRERFFPRPALGPTTGLPGAYQRPVLLVPAPGLAADTGRCRHRRPAPARPALFLFPTPVGMVRCSPREMAR